MNSDGDTKMELDGNNEESRNLTAKEYLSHLKPIWCSGCGDFAVLNALTQAFAKLGIPRHKIAVISGIGCSSRIPGYISTYGFNSLHGRAIPIATGVKLANPDNTVVVAGGDGDLFSIGGGHLPHAARRNVDLTVLAMDNRIYGLTKGQMSPTTPLDSLTSTTRFGSYDPPVNILRYIHAYGAGFIARGYSIKINQLASLIEEGIKYKGFSFIHILSPCITYRGKEEYDFLREMSEDLPEGYDFTDYRGAWEICANEDKLFMGLIYRNDKLISYTDRIEEMSKRASKGAEPSSTRLIGAFRA